MNSVTWNIKMDAGIKMFRENFAETGDSSLTAKSEGIKPSDKFQPINDDTFASAFIEVSSPWLSQIDDATEIMISRGSDLFDSKSSSTLAATTVSKTTKPTKGGK